MKQKTIFPVLCALMMCLVACEPYGFDVTTSSDEILEEEGKDYHASVATMSATDITVSSAVLNGKVSVDNPSYSSIEFGILIAKSQSDITSHIGQRLKSNKQTPGEFSIKISGLSPQTTYYYLAYIILDGSKVTFGQSKQFVTKSNTSGSENGHDYVDLGLSVKWATTNIGATYPESAGEYYAWGETSSKSSSKYTWSAYKWGNPEANGLTKYNSHSSWGKVDYKTTLDLADDVARANWGGKWRTPAKAEWDELLANCYWEWTTDYNGKAGYEISSSDGNTIFLPAVGYLKSGQRYGYGSDGYYWTTDLDSNSQLAYCLWFYSDFSRYKKVNWCYPRYVGLSIRAVCP